MWWYVAIISIFGKQRLEDHHNFMTSLAYLGSYQANMGYSVRLSQNKNKINKFTTTSRTTIYDYIMYLIKAVSI